MIIKFWNAASWSNFSAHIPAIRPSVPIMAAPRNPNTTIHSGFAKPGGANQTVTINTPAPTTMPRTMAAPA